MESGSGQEMGGPAIIGPNTSGIRGEDEVLKGGHRGAVSEVAMIIEDDGEDDDSDAFPIPLRTRRAKDPVPVIGDKRKR